MARELVFAPKGNPTEARKLRRRVASGGLERVGPGIFATPGPEPVEYVVRRNWAEIVGHFFPDGVVTDRTCIECRPTRVTDKNPVAHVFVSAPRSPRTVSLPGLVINQRRGAGPVEGQDSPFMGTTWIAGPARRVLDNIASSRARSGPARTLGPGRTEEHLEKLRSRKGGEALNTLRDEARPLAEKIDRIPMFEKLDNMIGTLLGSRDTNPHTDAGRARAAGHLVDKNCLERLRILQTYLIMNPPEDIPDTNRSPDAHAASCFIEAYFSNHIEGTRFSVNEAREIVFDGSIPDERPDDGHDVLATYNKLMEPPRPRLNEITAEEFVRNLRRDHGDIMGHRPSLRPGEYKTKPNMAGNTVFVDPEKVHGTLMEGFRIVQAAEEPFPRALMALFLVSDVHPFNDGNGRLCRTIMSRELISHGLSHIVVPIVFREDYLGALRALTRRGNPDILVRSMIKCRKVAAACAAEDIGRAVDLWAAAHAFLEDGPHVEFAPPGGPFEIEWRHGVPAPASYWRVVDFDAARD